VALAWSLSVPAAAAGPEHELEPGPRPECARGCSALRLRIRAAGERTPLQDVRVVVVPAPDGAGPARLSAPPPPPDGEPPWQRIATTTADGRATVEDVPRGVAHLVVLAEGFGRFDAFVAVPQARDEMPVFVVPDDELTYRTVVRQPAPEEGSSATSELLSAEEIRTLPGTQGDPLRALQNLPGMARAPASLGLLVVRGSPPAASRVYMGGHAVPRAFHVLSLASVFPTEVLDELRFVPGNFDPAYGNATGGVVLIEPRQGRRDGFHGYAELDLAAAGALVEGPVGKGSFVAGAQRGYSDLVLAAADSVIERATGEPQGFLRPAYYDYQGLFDHPLRQQGSSIGVRLFGSGDRLRSGAQNVLGDAGNFDFRSDFHRVDLVFRHLRAPWQVRVIPSLRFEINRFNTSSDVQRRVRRDLVFANRAEARRRLSRRLSLTIGSDVEIANYWGLDQTTLPLGDGSQFRDDRRAQGVEASIAAYGTVDLRLGPATLRPGARLNGFVAGSQLAHAFDPRMVGHVDLGDRWRLHAGLGRYSQARSINDAESVDLIGQGSPIGDGALFLPPVFSRFDPEVIFVPGAQQFTVRHAIHASMGAEVDLADDFQVGLTGFWREQDDGTPVFVGQSLVTFSAKTRSYGLELLARKRLTKKLYGWIAYTLMRAEVVLFDTPGVGDVERRPSDFDQRHNLIALASYELPRRWRLGGRFRVVSGYPFTPIVGSIALQRGTHAAILGARNSDRLPIFHQLDVRLDKWWIARRAIVTAFVDVQNVYNAQNPEGIVYTHDFRQQAGSIGVPIFPTVGVRVDY
jgi:hypothetical protein